jgi:hypothetical protein
MPPNGRHFLWELLGFEVLPVFLFLGKGRVRCGWLRQDVRVCEGFCIFWVVVFGL